MKTSCRITAVLNSEDYENPRVGFCCFWEDGSGGVLYFNEIITFEHATFLVNVAGITEDTAYGKMLHTIKRYGPRGISAGMTFLAERQ
jgi:hypothetical protein